jgi:hypothetical protein
MAKMGQKENSQMVPRWRVPSLSQKRYPCRTRGVAIPRVEMTRIPLTSGKALPHANGCRFQSAGRWFDQPGRPNSTPSKKGDETSHRSIETKRTDVSDIRAPPRSYGGCLTDSIARVTESATTIRTSDAAPG